MATINLKILFEEIDIYPVGLTYQREFHLSRGTAGSLGEKAPHIFIRVRDSEGVEGWGEARPSRYWSYETPQSVFTTLSHFLVPALMGTPVNDKAGFDRILSREIAPGLFMGQPIAKSALDMAWHDLQARRKGIPLADLFGGAKHQSLPLIYTVSASSPDEVESQITKALSLGYRGFKVKLGFGVGMDLELMKATRTLVPSAFLWADANQAYNLQDAITLARELESLGINLLEQPLESDDFEGLKELKYKIGIPLALDESVFSPNLLKHLANMKVLDAVVLKISKLGGLARTYECIQMAQSQGIQILASGLTESSLGFAAGCQLFATLDSPVPIDFNGPQFLSEDPGDIQKVFHDASGYLTGDPGIGIIPSEEFLQDHLFKIFKHS